MGPPLKARNASRAGRPGPPRLTAGALLLAVAAGPAAGRPPAGGEDTHPAGLAPVVSAEASPVTGGSWLDSRGLFLNETALGRMGRSGGPMPALRRTREDFRPSDPPGPSLMLTGADLYRLNCASCHGASGAGSPPEIRSVIGPVQATSPEFVVEQMRSRGVALDPSTAKTLAGQAEKVFRERLLKGGERMPPMAHLAAPEVDALLAYVRHLAGLPHVRQRAVVESLFRVGEHVVKGTCHTCHAATGPGPAEVAAMPNAPERDVRPSLAGIARERSFEQFAGKVREGRDAAFPGERGTMPVFDYLRPEEVRAALLYLIAYPPAADEPRPAGRPPDSLVRR